MGKIQLILAVLVLFTLNTSVFAKSVGNFKSYTQITDKEVLIETTNGSKVLFSAYNNFAIGVLAADADEKLNLTSPQSINDRKDLKGSIYVEELDELMQITTTNNDGLIIKIDKSPLRFTYIDKATSTVLFEEGIKFGKKSNDFDLSIEKDEELKLLTSNNYQVNTLKINDGEVVDHSTVNEFLYPENEICMISSKGYALVLDSKVEHEINYSKAEKIKIATTTSNTNKLGFLLVYGAQQPELISKYAFHSTPFDSQISLK